VTFHLIVFGWILFRSPSLSLAGTFLSRLASPGSATLWSAPVLVAIIVVIGLQLLPPGPLAAVQLRIERMRPVALGIGLALVIVLVGATVPSQGVPPFIYFRF
jgi:hypothetical protein